jgi:hypothetical protein
MRILIALLIAALSASFAYADDADTKITSIGRNAVIPGQPLPIVVPYLPYTVDIAGTVSHESGGGINPLFLWGKDNGVYFYEPTRYFKGSGNQTLAPFSIPWTIGSAGTHVIKVEATHDTASHSQCKAAPVIAASYLKTQSKKPNADTNAIAAVAHETGKGGALSAQDKCEPGYAEDVIFFVTSLTD